MHRAFVSGDGERALELASAPMVYWWLAAAASEGRSRIDRALAAGGGSASPKLRARAHLIRVWIAEEDSTGPAKKSSYAHAALKLFVQASDDAGAALALCELAELAVEQDDRAAGVQLARRALKHAQRAGDEVVLGEALGTLALTVPIREGLRLLVSAVARLERAGAVVKIAGQAAGFAWGAITAEDYETATQALDIAEHAVGTIDIGPGGGR